MKPFERRGGLTKSEFLKRFRGEVIATLKLLVDNMSEFQPCVDAEIDLSENLIQRASEIFAQRWMLRDKMSEIAFRGLLVVLEYCLSCELDNKDSFEYFLDALSDQAPQFWIKAVPYIFESDMQYGNKFRDALLFSLSLSDVTNGKYKLRELFATVPGIRNTLLARSEKKLEEAYFAMLQKRQFLNKSHTASEVSVNDDEDDDTKKDFGQMEEYELSSPDLQKIPVVPVVESQKSSSSGSSSASTSSQASPTVSSQSSSSQPAAAPVITSTLSSSHFQERVIAVSNAPPVSLKQDKTGQWNIGQGSGGLVSCCEPVMTKQSSNLWLACFGPEVPLKQPDKHHEDTGKSPTNSLGLPPVRASNSSQVHARVLDTDSEKEEISKGKNQLSLLNVLKSFNRANYKLKPVIVPSADYKTYYCGISNGLLWPAFHNLPEYIAQDYNDKAVCRSHWNAYVRVNYQFALNTVRNCRTQDFIWIHDYHLLLVGLIIRSLEPNIEVGFFLHIPFQPPELFFYKFKQISDAIVRALLGYTKVGFQTNVDLEMFLKAVTDRCSSSRLTRVLNSDKVIVAYKGFRSSFGVFPVSIKNEDFLVIAQNEKIQQLARTVRETVLLDDEGKLFFSAERFDYTKGIKEKLNAIDVYFERHADRIGKDVFFQIAVINRRTVETYKTYQDDCNRLAEKIIKKYKCSNEPSWKPLILQLDGLARPELIAHYLAMDVGIVTPIRDGMNLVAKEMLVCNPKASLVISTGAGTELQLYSAGFYTDKEKCYHRIIDIKDKLAFAQVLYEAAVETKEKVELSSSKLHKFLIENDIEKWSSSFLDPGWTHEVIHVRSIKAFREFYTLMIDIRTIRRQIVARVLKGVPLKNHYGLSLKNAQTSLKQSTNEGTTLLPLSTNRSDCQVMVTFDITDEIRQLEIDLAFLNYIQSEASDNLVLFLTELSKYHELGANVFNDEVYQVFTLLKEADHFKYFFTDRDGTMTSYACSYASSIQSAYSGVIQATFAQRCTQYSAILSSAPLCNVGILDVTVMPNGYYCYGSSAGREWFINENKMFKDDSISDKGIRVLYKIADKIAENMEQEDDFTQFMWVGSGLQRHYGHVTVAKQDCYNSVDEQLSLKWSRVITDLVNSMDPFGSMLSIQETTTDIKIYWKENDKGKIFNKGHGIRLLAQRMSFNLSKGNILLCADSESDIPMLKEVLEANPTNVYTVWVTKNEELKQKVIDMCRAVKNTNFAFARSPLVIVGAMAVATIREVKIRRMHYDSSFQEQAC